MQRKHFVQLTTALVTLGAAKKAAAQEPSQKATERERRMHEAWLKSLLENLDAQVDEPTRTQMMLSVGRACARRSGFLPQVQAAKGDLDQLVASLGRVLGKDNCRREGSSVHLRYSKCYCPIVGAGPERLSNTWCHCSRGWVHEMFETVTGKPVKVELTHSIKRGDADCRFVVRV